jgi:hypothetical protein
MRGGMFEADGAGLYYEVRGTGPALLMISGETPTTTPASPRPSPTLSW